MSLKIRLDTALKQVLHTCVIGAYNKISDIEKTAGWVLFAPKRYNSPGEYEKKDDGSWEFISDNTHTIENIEFMFSPITPHRAPLNDRQFSLMPAQKEMLFVALLTQERRVGNCQARCSLLAKYLWENPSDIQRIELLEFNFDHLVVVVNRSGNLNDPLTWGDALIIDPWYPDAGSIYTANEFIDRMNETKAYIKADYERQAQLGIYDDLDMLIIETDWDNPAWTCSTEIRPPQQRYPTYSQTPFVPVEHYYSADNAYPQDISRIELRNSFWAHQRKFQTSLKRVAEEHQEQISLSR